jgi:hypothetical protein
LLPKFKALLFLLISCKLRKIRFFNHRDVTYRFWCVYDMLTD